MALIPPFFLDCVVAIGSAAEDGRARYHATGFLYGHFVEQIDEKTKRYQAYLITNRHVFEGQTTTFLRFNPKGAEPARQYQLDLLDGSGKQLWLAHEDRDVDVAVIGINVQLLRNQGIRFAFFQSDQQAATRAKAIDIGVAEGDGVFVLGFPLGLVGEGRNFVVVRQGAIARIRDCLELMSKDFLIDCSVFPGNSGSPVVIRPEMTSIQGTKSINAAYLVGIVASYVPYQDVAISQQTRRPRVIFEENSGLASVFPMDHVDDLINKTAASKAQPPSTEEMKLANDH